MRFSHKNIKKSPQTTTVGGLILTIIAGLIFRGEIDFDSLSTVIAELIGIGFILARDKKGGDGSE